MTTKLPKPLLLEYLHRTAFAHLEHTKKNTIGLDLIGALEEMYLQTIFSDGHRKAPESTKQNLTLHYEAIKTILEQVEIWKEHKNDVDAGKNDDDAELTYTQDRHN